MQSYHETANFETMKGGVNRNGFSKPANNNLMIIKSQDSYHIPDSSILI